MRQKYLRNLVLNAAAVGVLFLSTGAWAQSPASAEAAPSSNTCGSLKKIETVLSGYGEYVRDKIKIDLDRAHWLYASPGGTWSVLEVSENGSKGCLLYEGKMQPDEMKEFIELLGQQV